VDFEESGAIAESVAPPKKKGGWPKGKPRKRKPRFEPEPERAPAPEPEPLMPVEESPAPETPQEGQEDAGKEIPILETRGGEKPPPAAPRRKRRCISGVTVDGRWFPCETAVLAGDRLILTDGTIETRVPVDGIRKIEFTGVSLSTVLVRPGYPADPEAGMWPLRAGAETGTPFGGRIRMVEDVQEYVNDPPDRDARVQHFRRAQKSQLESLMGPETPVGEPIGEAEDVG
jgi:hypothetical protein